MDSSVVVPFTLLFLVLLSTTTAKSLTGFSNNWMSQDSTLLGPVALNKLFIPGSHNSGSYGLLKPSDRPNNDPYPSVTTTTGLDDSTWQKIALDWSVAVERDIFQQLSDGIRFLDLQVCADKMGDFRFCNNLYGPPVQDGLEQILKFAQENPKEIVLASFRGFYGWGPNVSFSPAQHLTLQSLVDLSLAGYLADHNLIRPNSKLADIWATSANRPLLVLYDHSDAGKFWSTGTFLTDSSQDTWQVDEKKFSLVSGIAARSDTKLFNLAGWVQPGVNAYKLSLDPKGDGKNYPQTLKDMAESTNPVVFDWIINEWVPLGSIGMYNHLNVIMVDFYHNSCLFHITQNLNGVPNSPLDGCNIQQTTNWHMWKASQTCPAGYPDNITKCSKPDAYGRGAGYPWKFGDPLNTSKQMERCESDQGKGNCEVYGAVVYPKCKDLFDSYGCCMCTAECPGFLISVSPSSCLKV